MKRTLALAVGALLVAAACSGGGAPAGTSPIPSDSAVATQTGAVPVVAAPSATEPATGTNSPENGTGEHCGTERWSVKTLSDGDAAKVNFSPIPSTVTHLRALPAPSSLPAASRIAPTELTTFTVTAAVVEFKLEDDRDIHLVIADPNDSSATMIVEFPDAADCSGAVTSAHRSEMESARQSMIAAFGQPSSSHFTRISGTATISGVGFFDFKHGQSGVAPNAIELHPALSFTTGNGTAPSGENPPPPPPPPPPAAAAGVTFTSVVGGRPGAVASASVQTSAGASCSIVYVTPAGTTSTAQGLYSKTADSAGNVSWTWNIGSRTRPGVGTVTVTCGGASASSPIAIG